MAISKDFIAPDTPVGANHGESHYGNDMFQRPKYILKERSPNKKANKRQRPKKSETTRHRTSLSTGGRWACGPDHPDAIGFKCQTRSIPTMEMAVSTPAEAPKKTALLASHPASHIATGGLRGVATDIFERYHGLNGKQREQFSVLAKECKEKHNTTEAALVWLVAGNSYNDLLGGLRKKVPGYPTNLSRGRKGRAEDPLLWLARENSSCAFLKELRNEICTESSSKSCESSSTTLRSRYPKNNSLCLEHGDLQTKGNLFDMSPNAKVFIPAAS